MEVPRPVGRNILFLIFLQSGLSWIWEKWEKAPLHNFVSVFSLIDHSKGRHRVIMN